MPHDDGDRDQVKRARCLLRHLSRIHNERLQASKGTKDTLAEHSQVDDIAADNNEHRLWPLAFKWRRVVMSNWEKGNVRLIRTITPVGPACAMDFDEENNVLVVANKDAQSALAVCNLDTGTNFHDVVAGTTSYVFLINYRPCFQHLKAFLYLLGIK